MTFPRVVATQRRDVPKGFSPLKPSISLPIRTSPLHLNINIQNMTLGGPHGSTDNGNTTFKLLSKRSSGPYLTMSVSHVYPRIASLSLFEPY